LSSPSTMLTRIGSVGSPSYQVRKTSLLFDIGLPINQSCGSVDHKLTGTDPRILLFFVSYFQDAKLFCLLLFEVHLH
jgi:hypothetical protein